MVGKDELEGAMADQAVNQVSDFLAELVKVMMEPEEAKKAEMGKQLKVEKLPAFLMSMEKLLKAQGGKYFAGSSLTWADIVVYQFVSSMKVPRPSQPKALIEDSDLTGCPALSVSNQIKHPCCIVISVRCQLPTRLDTYDFQKRHCSSAL